MPRAYSTDLRERALAAYEAGEGRQSEIARLYRIGERTLSGWLKLAREEGRRAPKPRRGSRASLGGEREALAGLVAERNDATLAEYADRLAERTGVRRSPSALCRGRQALGLARKKRWWRLSGLGVAGPRVPRGAPGGRGWVPALAPVTPVPPSVNLSSSIDDAKRCEPARRHRWPDGVRRPRCGDAGVARDGRDEVRPHRRR